MAPLITIGVTCMAFTAAFTWRAYTGGEGIGAQTRRESIIEAWANILVGFSINYAMNLVILPLVGIVPTLAQNFWLGWIYTAVSIVRQYALRRWFNDRIHNFAARAARRLS